MTWSLFMATCTVTFHIILKLDISLGISTPQINCSFQYFFFKSSYKNQTERLQVNCE